MNWQRWIQLRSRDADFLWRMVIGILLVGVVVGIVVDATFDPWLMMSLAEDVGDESEPFVPPSGRIDKMAREGRWADVWWAIPGNVLDNWDDVGMIALAILTGACWLAFSVQAVQVRSWRDGRLWAAFVGVALGVLSVWPTLFLIYWQEHRWGLEDSVELGSGAKFYVLGVGLREEVSKFVCFLPLLPWCVRRRDELAALMLAGCVGIGFAMEENVNYISGSIGMDTLGRMLTPAPLHMALTGLLGLAAYRACVWPRHWAPTFVAMFGVVVLAHGFYDAFIALPALALDYNIVSGIIFVLLIYQFFREMRSLRARRVEPLSLTANFLFCVSMVAAATFAYLCGAIGLQLACDALMMGILGQAVMVYLFLREMPETMVQV
jgi:RsiW-degrading membrane proteinase PrsW (M82 family)